MRNALYRIIPSLIAGLVLTSAQAMAAEKIKTSALATTAAPVPCTPTPIQSRISAPKTAKKLAAGLRAPAKTSPEYSNLPSSGPVAVISIEGPIDPIIVRYVQRGYQEALESKAQCLIMKINTPGGLEQSMREIVQETLNSPIPTIAFVAPKGARAASAGAFIVIACHVTAMAPGTTIGAAHPVSGQGTDIGGNLDKKITNDTAAFMRSLAQQRGRDVKWSEEAVTKSLSVNENEALKKKLVDFVADDLDQLLAKLDGREITLNGVTHKLDLKRARLIHIALTLREKFFHMLAHPELAYILLSLGTLGLIFELQSPHGVSGPIGAICLVLALISLSILPFNAGGLLMMILAIGLFIADVKLNTHGILSLIGVTCLLFGSFMLFSPMEPFWRVSRLFIFAWVGLTAFAFGTIVYLGIKAQLKGASVGREILPGATGVAMTGLKPEGIVHVMGEEWSAHLAPGADSLHKGDRVRVISIDGLKLTVEPADNSGTPTNKGRT